MRKYPGYTFEVMMNEYAIRVYSMIGEAMKMDGAEALLAANVADYPHWEKGQRKEFISDLKRIAEDPVDELLPPVDENGTNKLKGLLGS